MIVNMPVVNGNGHVVAHAMPITAMDAPQGQCEYNFLKRKYDDEHNNSSSNAAVSTTMPSINNDNDNITTTDYHDGVAAWKKRQLEPHYDSTDYGSNAQPSGTTNIGDYASNTLAGSNSDNQNASSHNTTTSNNNNNSTDLTFNLLGNSAFINDLFAYDANLIVPVSSSAGSEASLCVASPVPAFATPTSICVNAAFDDGSNWQATDLLELDHRYNSALQTEITQLQPTILLKSTDEGLQTQHQQQQRESRQLQTQVSPSAPQMSFRVPEKQISNAPAQLPLHVRYRNEPTSPQQQQQQHNVASSTVPPEVDTDFEDKNLSWLLNFKFEELPHLSPDLNAANFNVNSTRVASSQHTATATPSSPSKSSASSPQSTSSAASNSGTQLSQSSTKAGKKFEELVLEVTAEVDGNDIMVAENVVVEDTIIKAPKKPPFTYTELIEYALEDKGELTVSGIYQWISDRFPYYKSNDDRWKNSVRHNLSINPHFRKGLKAPQGAGHLWTISSGDSAENVLAWEHKKQRLDLFFKMESLNRERLQQHQQQMQQRQLCTSPHHNCQQMQLQEQQQQQCSYDEAAVAAATIAQELLRNCDEGSAACTQNCSSGSSSHQRLTSAHLVCNELPFNDLMSDEELRKTAGQILNGIHREVEVQSVNSIIGTYHDVLMENEDYLNPIHKDVAVKESGLRSTTTQPLHIAHSHTHAATQAQNTHSSYYVTEIDPLELGIQMSHQVGAEEVLFNDDFNLNYFNYNANANDIAA